MGNGEEQGEPVLGGIVYRRCRGVERSWVRCGEGGAGEAREAAAAVVHHRGPVSASMINGEWALPPAAAHRL